MRGRKKKQFPLSERIRITLRAKYGLQEIKQDLKLPYYYRDSDTIETLILLVKRNLLPNPIPEFLSQELI
jgi:hypothetical protein